MRGRCSGGALAPPTRAPLTADQRPDVITRERCEECCRNDRERDRQRRRLQPRWELRAVQVQRQRGDDGDVRGFDGARHLQQQSSRLVRRGHSGQWPRVPSTRVATRHPQKRRTRQHQDERRRRTTGETREGCHRDKQLRYENQPHGPAARTGQRAEAAAEQLDDCRRAWFLTQPCNVQVQRARAACTVLRAVRRQQATGPGKC